MMSQADIAQGSLAGNLDFIIFLLVWPQFRSNNVLVVVGHGLRMVYQSEKV